MNHTRDDGQSDGSHQPDPGIKNNGENDGRDRNGYDVTAYTFERIDQGTRQGNNRENKKDQEKKQGGVMDFFSVEKDVEEKHEDCDDDHNGLSGKSKSPFQCCCGESPGFSKTLQDIVNLLRYDISPSDDNLSLVDRSFCKRDIQKALLIEHFCIGSTVDQVGFNHMGKYLQGGVGHLTCCVTVQPEPCKLERLGQVTYVAETHRALCRFTKISNRDIILFNVTCIQVDDPVGENILNDQLKLHSHLIDRQPLLRLIIESDSCVKIQNSVPGGAVQLPLEIHLLFNKPKAVRFCRRTIVTGSTLPLNVTVEYRLQVTQKRV